VEQVLRTRAGQDRQFEARLPDHLGVRRADVRARVAGPGDERCVGSISHAPLVTRPGHAGPDIGTPDAQMIGETSFELAILPGARSEDLLQAWERLALPLIEARVPERTGAVTLPPTGSLLEVKDAEVSAIRRLPDGGVEARIWNPTMEPRQATIAGATVNLGPARIETVVVR